MLTKNRFEFATKKKTFFLFFFFSCLLLLIGKVYNAGDVEHALIYLPWYYTDISVGFASRTFVGTLAKLISGDHITLPLIKGIIITNAFFCVFLLSVVLGRLTRKHREDKALLCVSVFLVFSASGVRYLITGLWLSVFDPYWITCGLLCIVCLQRKMTRLFLPLICFLGVWINYGFALTVFPVIAVLLFYECLYNKEDRGFHVTVFSLTFLVTFCITVYFVFFSKNHMLMDADQIGKYILSRLPEGLQVDVNGITAYLTDTWTYGDSSFTENYASILFRQYESLAQYGLEVKLNYQTVIATFPLYALFYIYWIINFRRNKNKVFRFQMLIHMLLPAEAFLLSVVTADDLRSMIYGILTQIACFLYLSVRSGELLRVEELLRHRELSLLPYLLLVLSYACDFKFKSWIMFVELLAFIVLFVLLYKRSYLPFIAVMIALSVFRPEFTLKYGLCLLIFQIYSVSDLFGGAKPEKRSGKKTMALNSVLITGLSFLIVLFVKAKMIVANAQPVKLSAENITALLGTLLCLTAIGLFYFKLLRQPAGGGKHSLLFLLSACLILLSLVFDLSLGQLSLRVAFCLAFLTPFAYLAAFDQGGSRKISREIKQAENRYPLLVYSLFAFVISALM